MAGRLKGHAKGAPLGTAELTAEMLKLLPQIEKLVGKTFQRDVPLSVLEPEAFRARAREFVAAGEDDATLAAEGTLAQLLGTLPADLDWAVERRSAREGRLSAFYDPASGTLFLQAGLAPGTSRVLLARGLAAALDDQTFDLEALRQRARGNGDERRALEALSEGANMSVMRSWALKNLGVVMPEDMQDATTQGVEALSDAPSALWKPDIFCGMQGAAFLLRLGDFRKAGDRPFAKADLAAACGAPPRSTEQVLHPEKYWDPATREEPIAVRFALADLPAGWSALHEDTLGEVGWGLVVEPSDKRQGLNKDSMARVKFSYRSTIGWGGDRCLLLGRDECRLLVCETVWDSAGDAQEFAGALAAHDQGLRAAAATYAARHGLAEAESGLEVARPAESAVTLVVWAGVPEAERAAVRAAVQVAPTGDEQPR